MNEKMVTKVMEVAYHRNGIVGDGFYVITFMQKRNRMVGILFPEIGQCACSILDIDLLNKNVVTFGKNSWRGDRYYDELLEVVEEYKNKYK